MTNEQLLKKLSTLEQSLRVAATLAPKPAQELAIAVHEDLMHLIQHVTLDDIAHLNRTVDNGKLLERRRTRFFVAYADHGIRLSALLFLLAIHTRRCWDAGKRGQQAGWRETAEWFGAQIGISGRQVYRLVKQGKALGLLDYLRTRRGMVVWIKDRKVYAQPRRNEEDNFKIGHYHLRPARLLGINGSILYRFLKVTDAEGNRKRLTGQSAAHRFPWLSQRAASVELQRLFRVGAIQRERAKYALSANAEWAYFWRQRTQEDRQKWRLLTNPHAKNGQGNKMAYLGTKWQVR